MHSSFSSHSLVIYSALNDIFNVLFQSPFFIIEKGNIFSLQSSIYSRGLVHHKWTISQWTRNYCDRNINNTSEHLLPVSFFFEETYSFMEKYWRNKKEKERRGRKGYFVAKPSWIINCLTFHLLNYCLKLQS